MHKNLNEAQQNAVAHVNGPCCIVAAPGSGKTTVITERVRHLITECRINPQDILVITFTKAAAIEMKERFQSAMGQTYAPVTFGTFHAIFFGILKHAYHYTADNILREEQKYTFLKEITAKLRLEIDDEVDFLNGLITEISTVKNERINLEHYYSSNCSDEIFRSIYRHYQERLLQANLLDFDDMLLYTYELLKERPDILRGWQRRFRYILIDEFQDINRIQYDIVRMLAEPEQNLFIVGDDDQSIYRFRGAKPEIMLNFGKDYPNAKMILLEENFRSTENIIQASMRLIRHNSMRFPKKIHGVKEAGAKIELHGFQNQSKENLGVIQKVQDYLKEGYTYQDIAILFRTNTGARLIAEKFMEYNLPFRMRDTMPNIYEHWIAKNIITYIRIAMGSRERKDFLQIINRPNRYISRECIDSMQISFENLRTYYEDKEWMIERIDQMEYDIRLLRKMTPYAAINFIRHHVGYEEYLVSYAEYRRIKAEELYEVLNDLQEAAKGFPTYEAWFAHMEEYAEALREQAKDQSRETDAVTFTTLHSSKGLEFPIVFIIDIAEGIIPHNKAVLDADLQEERRMFYVGMTRAKEKLHLYYAKERYGKKLKISRFLEELKKR